MARTSARRVDRTSCAVAGLVVGLALVLTGCSSASSSSVAASANVASSSPTVTTADSASVSPAAPTSAAAELTSSAAVAGAGPVTGKDFCNALATEQPKLDTIKSTDAAFVQLSLALSDLYSSKNALTSMDASKMDALTATCPDVAKKALKSTGKGSFAEFR